MVNSPFFHSDLILQWQFLLTGQLVSYRSSTLNNCHTSSSGPVGRVSLKFPTRSKAPLQTYSPHAVSCQQCHVIPHPLTMLASTTLRESTKPAGVVKRRNCQAMQLSSDATVKRCNCQAMQLSSDAIVKRCNCQAMQLFLV